MSIINWKNLLLKLSSVHTELEKKQQKLVPFKNEKGKETPLRAEFTGDKYPKSGDPAKKEVSTWKEQNAQDKTYRLKANPRNGDSLKEKNWRYLGDVLTNENAGRAEFVDKHDELALGAEPTYKTGTRFRVGSKFASRKSNRVAVLQDMGTFSKFKEKVTSGQYIYANITGEAAPANKSLIVVAYTRPDDKAGKVIITPLGNFVASFEYKVADDEKQEMQFDKNPDKASEISVNDTDLCEVPEGSVAYALGEDGHPKFFTAENIVQIVNEFHGDTGEPTKLTGDEEPKEGKVEEPTEDSDKGLHGESSWRKNAVSPPHSEYTVHELKKSDKVDNPFALAWYMKNKGMKLHDTKPKESSWKSVLLSVGAKLTEKDKQRTEKAQEEWNTQQEEQKIEDKKKRTQEKTAGKKPYFCNTCDSGFSEGQMNFHKNHEYEKRDEIGDNELEENLEPDVKETKEAGVEFQKKPDGTINIDVTDPLPGATQSPDMLNGQPMSTPQAPQPPASATPESAPAPEVAPATKGKKASYVVGSIVKDAELGEGVIESISGNVVVASFSGRKMKTALDTLG